MSRKKKKKKKKQYLKVKILKNFRISLNVQTKCTKITQKSQISHFCMLLVGRTIEGSVEKGLALVSH